VLTGDRRALLNYLPWKSRRSTRREALAPPAHNCRCSREGPRRSKKGPRSQARAGVGDPAGDFARSRWHKSASDVQGRCYLQSVLLHCGPATGFGHILSATSSGGVPSK
jgi:hypothetical protein